MEMDNAGGGLRGLRANPSPELFSALRGYYGIDSGKDVVDLGGSSSLNLLISNDACQYVLRVYRPYITETLLGDLHLVKRELTAHGVPCSEVVATRDGERARIDDLALTLYFTCLRYPEDRISDDRLRRLRRLVDAYDSGLDNPLTSAERAALPLAIARQPLWSVGGWIALLDDEESARRHAAGIIECALRIVCEIDRWQTAFA